MWFIALSLWIMAFVLMLFFALWLLARRIDRLAIKSCPPQAPLQLHGSVQWHALQMNALQSQKPQSKAITVLLIHGLGGNLCHYQMGVLVNLAQTHHVIAVDRPGSGYSVSTRPLSLSEQAQALHEWLDHQGIGQILIVGHSLGGAIALAMAQQRPDRVAGLSLLAPLTAAIDKPPPAFAPLALVPRSLYRFLAYTLLPVMGQWVHRIILKIIFSPVSVPAGFDVRGGGALSGRPSQILAMLRDMRFAEQEMPSIQKRCQQLNLPVQVLYDYADTVLDAQLQGAKLSTRLPKAQTSFIPNSGHMLPITQSQYCVDWIRSQLQTIDKPEPL